MTNPFATLALEASEPAAQTRVSIVQFSSARDVDPNSPMPEPDDATNDHRQVPGADDDANWDVFLPDDDELDPLPDPGDFWIDPA